MKTATATQEQGHKAMSAILRDLSHFIGEGQLSAIRAGLRGEEGEFFASKLREIDGIIAAMPATYGTEGIKTGAKIAWLHYFAGGQANWYIVEKDAGSEDDEVTGVQSQAFGHADLFGDGGELGYISIQEIIEAGGELDLYWKPKALAEIEPSYKGEV